MNTRGAACRRGEIWWAGLPGEKPGWPVLVVQVDDFSESAIRTVVCVVLTMNLRLAEAPGNIRLPARSSKLSEEAVVNVAQIITLDKTFLSSRVNRLPPKLMREVDAGLQLVLGLH